MVADPAPRPTVSVADEVWIATALLHREHPDRETFTAREITDRARREAITPHLRPGVYVHAIQHCVANRPPNPGRLRMLYATSRSQRRLYRPGDPFDPRRGDARSLPNAARCRRGIARCSTGMRRSSPPRHASPAPRSAIRSSACADSVRSSGGRIRRSIRRAAAQRLETTRSGTRTSIYLLANRGAPARRSPSSASRCSRAAPALTSAPTLGELLASHRSRPRRSVQRYRSRCRPQPRWCPRATAAAAYARIRRDRGIRPPDAIQLACAAAAGVDLFITNDERLSRKIVPGVGFVTSLARAPL
jgi:predicted nucleic acid-binding protein